MLLSGALEHSLGFGDYFLADSVSGDNGYVELSQETKLTRRAVTGASNR